MRNATIFDAVIIETWQDAITVLKVEIANRPISVESSWEAIALLNAGVSPRETAIDTYLAQLKEWKDIALAEERLLEENATGLLGCYLYIMNLLGEDIDSNLTSIFAVSIEHNLEKQKPLSIHTSVPLLTAIAAGLSVRRSPPLWNRISASLSSLLEHSKIQEVVQAMNSWIILDDKDTFPKSNIENKIAKTLESMDAFSVDRVIACYGQFSLARFLNESTSDSEMKLVESLKFIPQPDGNTDNSFVYAMVLPYLHDKLSYHSLFDSWGYYTSRKEKWATTQNYLLWFAVLLLSTLIVIILTNAMSWLVHLEPKYKIPIVAATVSVVLLLIAFIANGVAQTWGSRIWEQYRLERIIAIAGAIVVLATAILGAILGA